MQNNLLTPENEQGNMAFDIESLQNKEPVQQTSYSTNIPLKAGQLLGFSNAVTGYVSNAIVPATQHRETQRLLQSVASQVVGNLGMCGFNIPQADTTNIVTDNVVNLASATVGGVSGMLAMKASQILSNDHVESPYSKKFIADYILLATFVTMQLASKPHIKALCNKSEIFQNLSNKDYLKMKNIPQKTVNFFINSLSGAVASYCTSRYLANKDINDTAKVLTAGEVFAATQNATKVLLTASYNKMFGNAANTQNR
jgi:hypothetical protein